MTLARSAAPGGCQPRQIAKVRAVSSGTNQSPAIQSQRDSIGGLAPYRGAEI
jgi:hypothetical protein